MCCTSNHPSEHLFQVNRSAGFNPVACGCGCIGQGEAKMRLENYQEHLKAELKSVEQRIKAIKKQPE